MRNSRLSNHDLKNLKKLIAIHETAIVNVEKRIKTEGPIVDWYGKPYNLVEALENHKKAAKMFNNLLEKHNKTL